MIKENQRANYNELKILWNQATTKNLSRATCHRAAQKLGFKTYKVGLNTFLYCLFLGKKEAFTDKDSTENQTGVGQGTQIMVFKSMELHYLVIVMKPGLKYALVTPTKELYHKNERKRVSEWLS